MTADAVEVLLVGIEGEVEPELAREDGFAVSSAAGIEAVPGDVVVDALVLGLEGQPPLEAIRTLRARLPEAAIVVVTDDEHAADGTVALHAGAEDHLVIGAIPPGLLPRAIRYAVAMRRLRHELTTRDDATGLPNLRGFAPIAEHHLRMSDRSGTPAVFLFVRLDGYEETVASEGAAAADDLALATAEILLKAVRASDVPARIASDTFCVLLTGLADGAEAIVLSRLVESIAAHDARDDGRPMEISVGTSLYEPGSGTSLGAILESAQRRMTRGRSSAGP